MPRRARVVLANVPMHIIQRGNNRQACFYYPADYQRYLNWLQDYASASECRIHAYVLMTNHVHLLITPSTAERPGKLMKQLGQRYVQYINRTYRRSGTLWEGRYKSCLAQDARYLLVCHRYIESNPIRAGMVSHPAEYVWSSYRHNALGESNPLIQPHDCYHSLGIDESSNRKAYRELFGSRLEPGQVDEIRSATKGNYVLGDSRFKQQITNVLGRRVTRGNPGRPPKIEV